jgi:hypothetical protein
MFRVSNPRRAAYPARRLGDSMMKSSFRASLIALGAAALCFAAVPGGHAQSDANSQTQQSSKWAERWSEDRQAILDARLAGLKAGLKLTPDQEKLWDPFESAARDLAQLRMAHMQGMMDRMNSPEEGGPDPIDRLDKMATRLANAGAALKKVADAARPLYASLDDRQKRTFVFLAHEMMMMGHHGTGGMGPHESRHPGAGDGGDDGSED